MTGRRIRIQKGVVCCINSSSRIYNSFLFLDNFLSLALLVSTMLKGSIKRAITAKPRSDVVDCLYKSLGAVSSVHNPLQLSRNLTENILDWPILWLVRKVFVVLYLLRTGYSGFRLFPAGGILSG